MAGDSGMGILVVDDEEITLTMLRRVLKAYGFSNIVTVLNAAQAIKVISRAEQPFFIVISDQVMPGMSGTDFLAQVKVISPETRRIIMTGLSDATIVVEAINTGSVHKFIAKPWDNDELTAVIKAELTTFEKIQDKKRLLSITSTQNSQLFRYAKAFQAKEKQYAEEIKSRQEIWASLSSLLAKLQKDQFEDDETSGLNDLLSGSIAFNPENVIKALDVMQKEIVTIFDSLAGRTKIAFDPVTPRQGAFKSSAETVDDDLCGLMDRIIHMAGMAAAPALKDIGSQPSGYDWVDAYTQVPNILDLALADGIMSPGDVASLRVDMAEIPDNSASYHSYLLDRDLLSRKDFSRLYVKQSLIRMRIHDRDLGEILVNKGTITRKEFENLLTRQINRFQTTGECVSLSALVSEEKGIGVDPRLKGELGDFSGGGIRSVGNGYITQPSFSCWMLQISISPDKTRAFISIPQDLQGKLDVKTVLDMLQEQKISYGIVDEKLLDGFLKHCADSEQKFVVAMGQEPVAGQDARINYFFDIQNKKAGIVAEDGTIDFRDRGEIHHVEEGVLLAEKLPMVSERPGRDVFSDPIPVEPPQDLVIKPGPGTMLSEDGLKIYSTIEGLPSLNALGVVSVSRELIIQGNVDFETGHIDFQGNVIVLGTVKDGFRVTCVDLTANEVQGGQIELRGNLNVSKGIVDAIAKVMGKVQAKFINNSRIEAFDDVIVTREIMGSEIVTGGMIVNPQGRITASSISARKGMTLGQVGTERSRASILKAGVDDYLERMLAIFEQKLGAINVQQEKYHINRDDLEAKNFAMHKDVAELSFSQEKKQQSLKELRSQCLILKGKKSMMLSNLRV